MNLPIVFVAGHRGMVGSAIVRALNRSGNCKIITKSRSELDLLNQASVKKFFSDEKVDQVYLCAAKVGGIFANNTYPADFIRENLMMETNIIHEAFLAGVKKLLFLGSSCIYPKSAPQPMKEEYLLSGKLEPTNEPYAIAKIAGLKLCESYNRQFGESHSVDFRSVMPTNLYGPGDNYHPENSHVVPGLIRRFHEAKIENIPVVRVWGTGEPKREFLYVDDLAQACLFIMNLDKEKYHEVTSPMTSHINVGYGTDIKIGELARLIKTVVGYKGDIKFDTEMPDGTSVKLLDSAIINGLGWHATINLEDGLKQAYEAFLTSEQSSIEVK